MTLHVGEMFTYAAVYSWSLKDFDPFHFHW